MDQTLTILLTTAVGVAFVHTLIGVDHILPFVVLGKANRWTLRRTLVITGACGVGHVLSSVLLGVVGIGLGAAVTNLEWIEATRGDLAAWALIAFGLVYAAWALATRRRAMRQAHHHTSDGAAVAHMHASGREPHQHPGGPGGASLTVRSLFLIFVLGPCEPLIPLLMIPAATTGTVAVVLVTATFGVVTLATMMGLVVLATKGLEWRSSPWLERHVQLMAGLSIVASGVAIQLFGL
jgi:sulfite exporter TauE/SafE